MPSQPRNSGVPAGRPPKPTRLKVLHGDHKIHPERISKNEPHPGGAPEPPRVMSSLARDIWNRVAPDMTRTGVLTTWDEQALGAYCEAVVAVRVSHARMLREEQGQEPKGVAAVYVWSRAVAAMCALGSQLGMTPAARSRLITAPLKTGDDQDLLSG